MLSSGFVLALGRECCWHRFPAYFDGSVGHVNKWNPSWILWRRAIILRIQVPVHVCHQSFEPITVHVWFSHVLTAGIAPVRELGP